MTQSFTSPCTAKVGGVVLNLHSKMAVEKSFLEMQESVSRLASPEGFEGVTIQPMISLKGAVSPLRVTGHSELQRDGCRSR